MKVFAREKCKEFEAEQFLVDRKWPDGVEEIDGEYYLVINLATSLPIHNGDWIIDRDGKTEVVSDINGIII